MNIVQKGLEYKKIEKDCERSKKIQNLNVVHPLGWNKFLAAYCLSLSWLSGLYDHAISYSGHKWSN